MRPPALAFLDNELEPVSQIPPPPSPEVGFRWCFIIAMEKETSVFYGLSVKYTPQAHAFELRVPSYWCFLEVVGPFGYGCSW